MKEAESVFEEFIDAISAAEDDDSFEQVASRAAKRLGFRWYAYLCLSNGAPKLISSYPKTWTSRYFDLAYQHLDPVVQRARLEHDLFKWGGAASTGGDHPAQPEPSLCSAGAGEAVTSPSWIALNRTGL